MHVKQAEYETSAVKAQQYPLGDLPEIALLGRSNVGKSSFINRMVSRSKLARTSSQPGKTQTLNFYRINNQFRFVDVPGYGYAKIAKSERQAWTRMIESYLSQRPNLALIFLLMDMRHPPSQLDCQMYQYIDRLDLPFAIILTKSDKIAKNQWNKHFSLFKNGLQLPTVDALFPFSSENGQGSQAIWEIIETIIYEE